METHFPHQNDECFILEQLRAKENVKYPLPPEILDILDRVKICVP